MPLQKPKTETGNALRAFRDYEALGPGRTIQKLWEQYQGTDRSVGVPTRNLGVLKVWSTTWGWQKRLKETERERRDVVVRERTLVEVTREQSRQGLIEGFEKRLYDDGVQLSGIAIEQIIRANKDGKSPPGTSVILLQQAVRMQARGLGVPETIDKREIIGNQSGNTNNFNQIVAVLPESLRERFAEMVAGKLDPRPTASLPPAIPAEFTELPSVPGTSRGVYQGRTEAGTLGEATRSGTEVSE